MEGLPIKLSLSATVLFIVVACGKATKDDEIKKTAAPSGRRTAEVTIPVDGSNIEGHYQAKFITLNPQLNGTIPGSANFFRKDEKIYAYVRLFAGGVRAWHQQFVYTGNRCPEKKDDINQDGFIDIIEAEKVLGKILIPLDSDIGSQSSGRRFFPLGDLSGYYHYERITNFQRFFSDLKAEDNDLTDDMVKLPSGKGLDFVGKAVLIQGVIETIDFPATVASKGRFRPFQTLPVACGIFEKIVTAPGTPYVQDEIPGPLAEVIEGQDRPATEETPEAPEGGTTGGTDTNESDDGNGPVSDGEGRTRTDDTTDTTNPPRTGDYGDDDDNDSPDEDTPTDTPDTSGESTSTSSTDTSTTTSTTTTSSSTSSSDSSSTSGGE